MILDFLPRERPRSDAAASAGSPNPEETVADISVERKDRSIWPWILGLLLLGLLIWGLLELLDNDNDLVERPVATEPAPVVDPVPPVVGAAAVATPTIADVLANPAAYAGQSFSTQEVRVAEVTGDRGFWIENNGQRMFVVKNESPQPGVADVQGPADTRASRNLNVGDRVQINGMLLTSADQAQPPLDNQTRQLIQQQPVFLQANVADIRHLDGGTTTP